MEEKVYLGIDVGTTHLKVCAVCGGRIAALSVRAERYFQDPVFGSCLDAEQIWKEVWSCLKEICGWSSGKGEVCGIGITGMAEACVLLDKDGSALLPVLPWNSGNPVKAPCGGLWPGPRGSALYRKTGLIWQPKYTANRLWYLKTGFPELWEKTACVLSVPDYILFCLTGERMTEESLACRTMLYHIFERRWDEELTALTGVKGKLPRVNKEQEEWPRLRPSVARELALSQSVRACVAGHDHLCAAAAEGLAVGEALNSMGTSEVYAGFLAQAPETETLYRAGIQTGLFAGRYYWICNLPSSGGAFEWLRGLTAGGEEKLSYERLFQKQGKKPSEVLFLPFLGGAGTHRSGEWSCTLKGMRPDTGLAEVVQGVCEGVACESRAILELVGQAEIPVNRLVSVGGGTKNRLLMQAKADITGRCFEASGNAQASAAGAAVRAGARLETREEEGRRFAPDAALAEVYERKYRRYQEEIERQRPGRRPLAGSGPKRKDGCENGNS